MVAVFSVQDGVSVMEKAATGPEGGPGSNELLPVVFLVPKLYYPSTLESLCSGMYCCMFACMWGVM